jgi:hypothetical protein|tara:strand:+ start:722 stop:937 length:216 start_codon:yes stop_codon:yes gene_type:complete
MNKIIKMYVSDDFLVRLCMPLIYAKLYVKYFYLKISCLIVFLGWHGVCYVTSSQHAYLYGAMALVQQPIKR